MAAELLFPPPPRSKGDVALLNCTSIVNTSSESLNDKNPVSDSIHQLAGPELKDELLKLKGRKPGKKEVRKERKKERKNDHQS